MKRTQTITQIALEKQRRIEKALKQGAEAIRQLDPIVRETYRDDPAAIAEWEAAIRLDPPTPRKSARAAPSQHKKND